MFVYIAYEDLKNKYLNTQKRYNEILQEKEILFQKTQPKAINYDKEKIVVGYSYNAFDEYLIAKEKTRVDERLAEIKSILDDRERLLNLKEQELRESKNHIDQIYTMRYIDQVAIRKIARVQCYSESQIYRILDKIKNTIATQNNIISIIAHTNI